MAAAVPAVAAGMGCFGASNGTLTTAKPEEADDGRHEPKDGGQEGEGDDSLGFAARIASERNVTPGKDSSACCFFQVLEDIPVSELYSQLRKVFGKDLHPPEDQMQPTKGC